MEQVTYFEHVSLGDVAFHQPDEQTRQKLTAKWNKELKHNLTKLILCAILFTAIFLLIVIIPGLIVGTIFIIAICCTQHSIKDPENIGVRFGTVTDHYKKRVRVRKQSSIVHHTTIRLDDSGQIVQVRYLDPRKLYKEPIGRQILIAEYRGTYRFFPAEFSESPPPPEVPEPIITGYPHETTIDRISPEELSADTQVRVRHACAKKSTIHSIFSSIVPLIIIGAFTLPFLQIEVERRELSVLIFYLLIAAMIIAAFVILHIRNLIRFKQVSGIPVQLLHYHLSDESVDFQVLGTGQIVRMQHIRFYLCKGDQTGNIVLLVFHPDHEYSIFPSD